MSAHNDSGAACHGAPTHKQIDEFREAMAFIHEYTCWIFECVMAVLPDNGYRSWHRREAQRTVEQLQPLNVVESAILNIVDLDLVFFELHNTLDAWLDDDYSTRDERMQGRLVSTTNGMMFLNSKIGSLVIWLGEARDFISGVLPAEDI